ncbi:MAG: stage III sporulation protein AE [Ruminococcaceae bacterium]|nr:stage III sporulation protein AE [Oscillospiraceae bacterium]
MRRLILLILLVAALAVPICAAEYTAPTVPPDARPLMPAQTESFGQGLWTVIKSAVALLRPDLTAAARTCLSVVAVVLLTSILNSFSGNMKTVTDFVCPLAISAVLLGQTSSLVELGVETVQQLSEYAKLLLPVMTGALATQGGTTGAAALYGGTMLFNTVLVTLIGNLLVPMIYIFLALSIGNCALGEQLLKKLRDFSKWLMTWTLKIILYVFTGYMSITGVISGAADAAAVKALKLSISGMVPVVGGILSDAAESVVLGAGVMKSAAGVYGLTAIIAIFISPFLQISVHYLILKVTAAVCGAFDVKAASELIEDFSGAMGLLLGMTGTVCIMLMISMICFLKGMG